MSNEKRWYEYEGFLTRYFIRYFIGTILGSCIIYALFDQTNLGEGKFELEVLSNTEIVITENPKNEGFFLKDLKIKDSDFTFLADKDYSVFKYNPINPRKYLSTTGRDDNDKY